MTAKLNLLVLNARDIEKAKQFFSVLGLRFEPEQHGEGQQHYTAIIDDLVLELYPPYEEQEFPQLIRLGFRIDSIDERISQLVEKGGDLIVNPYDSKWGRRAVVQYEDGHIIELIEEEYR